MFLIKPFDNFLSKTILAGGSLLLFALMSLGIMYIYLETNLPDVETLKNIQFQEPLRIYSKDSKLMAEFGTKRRTPIDLAQVPQTLIDAILATEDQRFFEHPGIDFPGLVRAAINVIKTGRKSQGASTITMQVARNFFLHNKKTFTRKINEILLAIKIDKELSKEKILELYLNKIYFGQHAYGIVAAAQVYYDKTLDELNLSQLAMIAGLPQSPSRVNPIRNPSASLKRRKHVLGRMLDENKITKSQFEDANAEPVTAKFHKKNIELHAPYVSELIRSILYKQFGESVYTSGLKIFSTIDSFKQESAYTALIQTLTEYDRRHGYRGPIGHIDQNIGLTSNENTDLDIDGFSIINHSSEDNTADVPGAESGNTDELAKIYIDWSKFEETTTHKPVLVTKIDDLYITVQFANNELVEVAFSSMQWAAKHLPKGMVDKKPTHPTNVVSIGDIIHIQQKDDQTWGFSQIPNVEGGFVAIDPRNNHVEAMVGGYNFTSQNFNHVTQAKRQPGSCIKPFMYAAALEKGYTLATNINDAPVVQSDQSQDNYLWRPQNNNKTFKGMTSLRKALSHSVNLVSIRLLDAIGVNYARKFVANFGFPIEDMPASLSISLGSAEVTPLSLAAGYCVFANGGKKAKPYLVSSITDSKGKVLTSKENDADNEECKDCNNLIATTSEEQVISPQIAYIMTSILKDTIRLGRPGWMCQTHLNRTDIAGKTGSTNSNKDAWFAGYHPTIVAVSWVGFDNATSIFEYGGRAAFPMWLKFMKKVLKGMPTVETHEPEGIVRARIDPVSGLLASSSMENSFFEIFREEYAPTKHVTLPLDDENDNTIQPKHLF